jgi:hypothetical protein
MTTQARVAAAIVVGALIITGLLLGVLLQTPEREIASNSVVVAGELGPMRRGTEICQGGEQLPASTQALRLSVAAYLGPAVSLTVLHDGVIVARGHHGAEWVSGSLTFHLKPAIGTETDATICLTRDRRDLALGLLGGAAPAASAATANRVPLAGRMRIEYLTHGDRSWLALAHTVARRLGLGHSPSGTWIVLLLLAMMATACALAAKLLTSGRRYE